MQKWMKLCLIALIAAATVSGCRTSRRGVRVGGDAAELKVYLNFPPHNFDAASFSYELSGCEGIPALTGAPSPDLGFITFKAVGLKQGMLCQLRVKDLAADPNLISFTGEDKVLFWASQVVVTQDADGTLKSNPVSLVPLYQIKPQAGVDTYKLKVPVAFDKAPEDGELKAILDCEPSLWNPSVTKDVKGKKGSFTFGFVIGEAGSHTCKKMTVRSAKQTFDGSFAKPFTFSPEKDVTITSDQTVTLKLVDNGSQNPGGPGGEEPGGDKPPPTGEDPDEVTVETSPEDCTGDRYYDVEERKCKDKPATP